MASWKQLKFNKTKQDIVDNILLDFVEDIKYMDNIYFSEYYFDSTADAEIEFAPEAKGGLAINQAISNNQIISNIGIGRYQSPVTVGDAPFGEDC